MARKNPNSSIRSGYKYEDLYVLELCIEWLCEPEKFNKIKIQYIPEGLKGFAIDDIVVENADSSQSYYQLKYKQNPEVDKWSFENLIEKGLFRWINSYKSVNNSPFKNFSLITNGTTDIDVQTCLKGNNLDLTKIRQYYPEVERQLKQQFTDKNLLLDFFSNFTFIFNHPDKYDLEDKLRKKLYDELKVTKAGVDSLLLYIGNEGSEQYPKAITLSDIRKYLSWDNPRPLNQNFKTPADFEFFDRDIHQKILSDLQMPEGGTKIFIGKPGAGKSTYLSKLYDILNQKHITVFRHHYHLNPKDHSHLERLNADRVKEALRAAFKKEKSRVLEKLGMENTEHTPLREFINKIATYYAKQGKTFVLIIDGLDHVIREGNSETQLQEFINEIFYPQKGYWLLLGTQEIAIKSLPNALIKTCPEDKWIEIKGLNRSNVARIVKSTLHLNRSRKIEHLENELINKIFRITGGNPLHLRYVLEEIINSGEHISSYHLDRIPPYKGDIQNYYEDIWRQLPDLAKTFCFAISALDFKLHKEQLIQLGGYFTPFPADVSKSFKEIKHLIFLSELSGISVYHNSFMVFMKEQPELEDQKQLLYKNILIWLKDYNDENLKWSEVAKIEYYLGNPLPILSIDKDWLIKSYLECRDENQIQNLLDLASEAAFKNKDLKKVIFFGEISSRFKNRLYNLWDENLHKIWVTSFRNNAITFIKYPDFSRLTHYQLKELLIAFKERGIVNEIPKAAIERINILFQDRDFQTYDIAKSWLEVLLNFENISNQRIFKFLKQFRKGDRSELYFAFYVKKILENRDRFDFRLTALLKSKLTDQEKKSIGQVLVQEDLKNGRFEWKKRIKNYPLQNDDTIKVYNYLYNQDLTFEKALNSRHEFPEKYSYSTDNLRAKELYFKHFSTALFLMLSNQVHQIHDWLKIEDTDKQTQLLKAVLQLGMRLGDCWAKKIPVIISDILQPLESVPELDFYKDHSLYEIRRSVIPKIIDEVIWLAHVFNTYHRFDSEIQIEEIEILTKHPWYYQSNLFELLHDHRARLSPKAFSFFAGQELEKLSNELVEFKYKTETMANLAILAADLKNSESLNLLLYRATENLIAYGNHKDMLLYDILLGIEKLQKAGSGKHKELLRRIAPYIYHIDKLTDGDETGSFIYDYASLLAKSDVPVLYNFYFLSLRNREYYLSERLFGEILYTLDFSDKIGKAIGSTAVGDASYFELSKIASEDPLASEVLQDIHNSLGKIDFGREQEKENERSNSYNNNFDETSLNVQPSVLANFLSSSTYNKYEKSTFILKWAKTWLNKTSTDRKQLITVLKEIIEKDYLEVEHDLLDYLYPFALTIDREFAFKCICWAQSNSGSWSSDYFSRPEEARARWKKVFSDFPFRIIEFFDISINNSGLRYRKTDRKNYSISAPKTIQFFIDAGQVQKAEEIAGNFIDILLNLFPNVNLPEPEFYRMDSPKELFDILLLRFEWLSPIVKERAAKQLIMILSEDVTGTYHQKYFSWLKMQTLESKACEGLMILLISVQTENSHSKNHLTTENLGDLLCLRCMATDLITGSIGKVLDTTFKFSQPLYVSMSFGKTERTKLEFDKLVVTNLPCVYLNYIEELQENSPFEIWSCWNTLFNDYCNEYELTYTKDDERFQNDFNSVMIGRATIFAEILRSSFFRILDYLHFESIITIDDLFRYTIANFTIDPSVWKLILGNKPIWWPKFEGYPKLKYDEKPPEINMDIEKVLSSVENSQVLSLNTVLTNTDYFYHGDYFYGLEIVPFAYSGEWHDQVEASNIFHDLYMNAGIWHPRTKDMRDFGVFSNELKFYNPTGNVIVNGKEIIPLIAPVRLTGNMFQYYRSFYRCRLLTPIIKNQLDVKIYNNKLSYFKENLSLGYYQDFLDGLRDASDMPELLPYNTFLILDKKYLLEFLKEENLNLGYAIKKTLYTKNKYGQSQEFEKKEKYSIFKLKV